MRNSLTILRLLVASPALLDCGARTALHGAAVDDGSAHADAAIGGSGGATATGGTSGAGGAGGTGGAECLASGYCTTTTSPFLATFGGLAQADAICAAEYPGSHFYRKSCDQQRPFYPAVTKWPSGYAEIEAGACWNCNGWTTPSGPFEPSIAVPGCTPGYATVAALVPGPMVGAAPWRICEAGDWPLACCLP